MATNIPGVADTPALTRHGKAKTAPSGQPEGTNRSWNLESAVDAALTVDLSPESVSKAQKIVTGSGSISSSDPGEIDFTDEQALELAVEMSRQLEKLAGGLLPSPSAELAGMVG